MVEGRRQGGRGWGRESSWLYIQRFWNTTSATGQLYGISIFEPIMTDRRNINARGSVQATHCNNRLNKNKLQTFLLSTGMMIIQSIKKRPCHENTFWTHLEKICLMYNQNFINIHELRISYIISMVVLTKKSVSILTLPVYKTEEYF